MTWDSLRDRWQREETASPASFDVDATLRRAQGLRRKIFWRDGIETAAALVLLPVVWGWFRSAMQADAMLAAVSAAFLLAHLIHVPWRLWRTWRQWPRDKPGLSLRQHLQWQRQALLAQAHMLKQVAWWYVAPFAIGLMGWILGSQGMTPGAFTRVGVVLAMCVLVVYLNRRAARRILSREVEGIDQSLSELETLEQQPAPQNNL